MKLMYEIDQSALGMETFLRVYDDHIELRKPDPNSIPTQRTRAADSLLGNVAKITKMMVFDVPKSLKKARYLDFNVMYNQILKVEYKPAKGVLATGRIQFYLKNEPEKRATQFDIGYRADVLNFNSKQNDIVLKIKKYVDSKI